MRFKFGHRIQQQLLLKIEKVQMRVTNDLYNVKKSILTKISKFFLIIPRKEYALLTLSSIYVYTILIANQN